MVIVQSQDTLAHSYARGVRLTIDGGCLCIMNDSDQIIAVHFSGEWQRAFVEESE